MKTTKLVLPLVLAATAALGLMQAAQATPAPEGEVQLLTTDGNSGLAHTVRGFWGNWQQFGHIDGYNGVTAMASIYHFGEEHAFVQHDGGQLSHLVRHQDGNWDYQASTPAGDKLDGLSATDYQNHLTLVGLRGGNVQMTSQQDDGSWAPWTAVPSDGRSIRSVAVVNDGVELKVVELAADGKAVGEFERSEGNQWSKGNWQAANQDPGAVASEISAAYVAGQLQVAAVETRGGFTEVDHATMTDSGGWSIFRSLTYAIGVFYGNAVHVAVVPWVGALQLAYSTSDGRLYHTVRYENGNWQSWGDVEGAAGNITAGPLTMASATS
ncbi:hypothetical protein [Kutzneria kofuensis]|uniref:Uncharacterized protein n=1 Tax=Kutzneria kofuensis TaxID=103725 RepID=A0A7W9KFE8_9PSEU|nr:hypothetical protein [Kutzneria kofuensis]MBB5891629.1 hypothetical protein [Kutzneria kofuensis]